MVGAVQEVSRGFSGVPRFLACVHSVEKAHQGPTANREHHEYGPQQGVDRVHDPPRWPSRLLPIGALSGIAVVPLPGQVSTFAPFSRSCRLAAVPVTNSWGDATGTAMGSLLVAGCERKRTGVYTGLQVVKVAELGPALRAAREAAGLSLAALAARTHYSKPLLGLLETGRRTIKPEHVVAYSRALFVSLDSLYGPPDDPLRLAHDWLVSDTPVAVQTRFGRRVGADLAAQLESRVIELRHLDDFVYGSDLFPLVRKELADAQAVVSESTYTDGVGRRLLTVVGELSQLAGWVASDAGRYQEAQNVYLSGVSAARDAGDRALAGQLLSSLSYQMANVGNPADAVLLARSAAKGAEHATPVVRTLLLERVAWACARSRDRDGTRRALDLVDDTYEQRGPIIPEPEWVYWLNRSEIDVMAGRCLIELGQPAAAEPLLSAAIDSYQAEHIREVALYLSWLAESYARSGELDAARDTLDRARTVAAGGGSVRLDTRLQEVQRLT
jgi:transcriptional regulator with XRE-family HTH domain